MAILTKRVLYDSGVVAAGAQIQSPVLDFLGLSALEVIVDNTAGAVLRDLQFQSFGDDGVTTLDSGLVIRRVGFGAAPAGSVYAPGAVRGYVGPNPPGGTSGVHVLYSATGAANTAVDTGFLSTEGMGAVRVTMQSWGGTSVLTVNDVDDSGGARPLSVLSAGANAMYNYGHGSGSATGGGYTQASAPRAIGRRTSVQSTAAGPGNQVTVIVEGVGPVPGTFAHQMALPPRGQFTLAANGGAANGRLIVLGSI